MSEMFKGILDMNEWGELITDIKIPLLSVQPL